MIKKYLDHALNSIIAGAVVGFGYFLIDMWAYMKYKMPAVEQIQNERIDRQDSLLIEYFELTKEKNKNTQRRIDRLQNSFWVIENKLDSILRRQDIIDRRQKFIFKEVKELKPYSEILTEKPKL